MGDFGFTVTGNDATATGGSRSTPATLHIYDFAVSISPADVTVLRGGSTSYTVTLTLSAGSSTPPAVSLSASQLPGGSSSSFSAGSVAPTLGGAAVTLAISTYTGAPGPTALGDFAFTVTGQDNADPSSGSRQVSANLSRLRLFAVDLS